MDDLVVQYGGHFFFVTTNVWNLIVKDQSNYLVDHYLDLLAGTLV